VRRVAAITTGGLPVLAHDGAAVTPAAMAGGGHKGRPRNPAMPTIGASLVALATIILQSTTFGSS
jgi:hypothetical protein